jgi:hypothetical protein
VKHRYYLHPVTGWLCVSDSSNKTGTVVWSFLTVSQIA